MTTSPLAVSLGLAALLVAGCGGGGDSAEPPLRTVAFDNRYGTAATLPVHVSVDGGPEQSLTATCEGTTCTFKLPLTNASHELTVVVEQDGKRSPPSRVAVDTSALP